ncbi:MAG TPA: TonB family protein [Pyrinomonadaceae bacterium]|nr:TonB family protein [Pyrinomonadaceae bacterium]
MNFRVGLFLLLSLFIIGAGNAFSQNPAPVLKDNTTEAEEVYKIGDVRGNIKRKAVLLPKPSFPREALEAGADGIVKVEVVIDAQGNVVSAKALAGHPLLFASAEETARRTKFRSVEPADENAKETGVITYNFAIEKAGWTKIAYDLAAIQKAPTLRPFNVPRIAKAFDPEWTGEREILDKLAEMRRVEIETQNPVSDKPVFVRQPDPNQGGAMQSSIKAEIQLPVRNPPTGERIALAQNLTASLQSRLANDEANLWRFNLGIDLAKTFEIARSSPNEAQSAAQILKQAAENAPAGISVESLTALRKLTEILENEARNVQTINEIGKLLAILFRSK